MTIIKRREPRDDAPVKSRFTDQKKRVATDKDLNTKWSFGKPGENFRCYICGYRFVLGDIWRWVYACHVGRINFLVCEKCDCDNVLDKWVCHTDRCKEVYWWSK